MPTDKQVIVDAARAEREHKIKVAQTEYDTTMQHMQAARDSAIDAAWAEYAATIAKLRE